MKIAIIGSGNIGGNLGLHWTQAGHEVLFSSRHPDQLQDLVRQTEDKAKAVSVQEAFEANADVYLLAVPFKAIPELAEVYAGEFGGKVLIDATNSYPDRDGAMAQEVKDSNQNASEYTAMKFSTALTAKAFNTIYFEHLKDRAFQETDKLAIPFAAQSSKAQEITRQLIEDIGFDAVFIGDLSETKIMDPEQLLYAKSTNAAGVRKIIGR